MKGKMENVLCNLASDAFRVIGIMLAAFVVLTVSPFLAGALMEPGIEVFGVYTAMLLGGIAVSHVARRLLFPGIGMRQTARDAASTPQGAGTVFLGMCIVLAAVILSIRPAAASMPANASIHINTLVAEQRAHWPAMVVPDALAGLVEQETCASLTHSKCWSPRAELRTAREYGFGLGQLTVTPKFNAFTEITARHKSLRGWQWADRYNPTMQARAVVLKMRDNHAAIKDTYNEWGHTAMALAAYNGGLGGLAQDRRLCRATPGCDQSKWTGHVEKTSYKAKIAVKGYGKSFFEINREYVRNVMNIRKAKYTGYFKPELQT